MPYESLPDLIDTTERCLAMESFWPQNRSYSEEFGDVKVSIHTLCTEGAFRGVINADGKLVGFARKAATPEEAVVMAAKDALAWAERIKQEATEILFSLS